MLETLDASDFAQRVSDRFTKMQGRMKDMGDIAIKRLASMVGDETGAPATDEQGQAKLDEMQGKIGEASEVATIEKLQKDLRAMLGDAKGADKQKAVRVAQQVRPLVRFLLGVGVPDEDEAPASE